MKPERQPADEQFAVALRHHRAGRLIEAERLYRQICAADTNHVGSWHLLGVLAHQLGREDAADLIGRAVALKPEFAEAHNDLGVVLGAQGKLAEAIACFEHAASLKPNYAEARLNLANALQTLGRLDQAAATYEQVLAIDPKLGIAHYNLAATRKQQGSIEQAVAHYRRAVALMPNFAEAHNNLSNALRELSRLDEALAHYERALAIDPAFAPAHYNCGVALRSKGKIADARASFERALKIRPDFLEAKFALCMAQLPILCADEPEIARARADYRQHLIALRDDVERSRSPGDLAEAVGAHQPFYLAYQGGNDRDLQALYGSLVCRIMAARYPPGALPAPPREGELVRVGIVSGFLRRHSNW